MEDYYIEVRRVTEFIEKKVNGFKPQIGLITGTGLSGIVDKFEVELKLPYGDIPGFPVSTVQSHKGQLVFANYHGLKLVVLQGRFHYYEGYSMQELTLPVRVLKELGCERFIFSNVTGSVNPDYEMGDVVFIRDHINLMGSNPLRGKNFDKWGPRFPDMKSTYNEDWNRRCKEIAESIGFTSHLGVYCAFAGPNLETPAEYIFLNRIGADLVGMSTVPEVLVAKHMEVPVLVFSLVSNKCYPPEAIRETSVEDVISVGEEKAPLLQDMLCKILESRVLLED
ncbi:MAG: purine-nucleoside phosphorylase [Saprospirales bacterium]|nr:MAG: purine-nucleoside phosphorylase [Saprospirales bacterium]